ncbi:uncharacterized protein PFL1_03952 [Pseudozyma flocculosa PF-1]|uniref:Glutamine amidotransferase domain-containing protein n=2 Tax=Pseudozyma flocculosa TaxID=84751 RepID=A0A5C3EXU6_9BASI|nr:uncharacterized protein PFL1_03952 [Pseudozyma flocculosa PF-1]EPQ28649.1 hypothetical protein PFL1_03952 [Pseudozyma flocculosa PF-1]SPO36595.1 uncharacterized protein PSFLO_02066 [Pseudozyma flocculosa]
MPAPKKRQISIAVLVADTPVQPVLDRRGDYTKIYPAFLQSSLNTIKRHAWQDSVSLHVRCYDVVTAQEYPDQGQLSDGLWDAIVVTGSAHSAYSTDEWAGKLASFLRDTAEKHPLVRLVGICYGHQIIARAFDGKVELNSKGWEFGTTACDVTEVGRELLGYGEGEKLNIQQVHRDHVTVLPSFQGHEFLNLASTDISAVQGMAHRYPTEAPPLPSSAATSAYLAFDISDEGTSSSGPSPLRSCQILTFQGHPEFDAEIVELVLQVRTEKGVIDRQSSEKFLENAHKPHDGLRIGRLIWSMLGVEEARTDQGDEMVAV